MRFTTSALGTRIGLGIAVALLVVGLVWLFDGLGGGGSGDTATTYDAPERVVRTLSLIDAGEWPAAARAPGTSGGRTFRNNEGHLPRTDATGARARYQEWDVNPKKPGRSRDAERIITGADGSAWYTLDHYRSFHQIRGPSR